MRRWLPLLLLIAPPVAAQAPPACTPAREGEVACLDGKLCACRFERGGQISGRRDRFAWDCGALRPTCPPEPGIAPPPGWAPPAGVWVRPGRRH